MALASGSRDTPVWCMIYEDLCYEHEADIFANQMKFVKQLLPYEVFSANIEAGNSDQLIIRDLVESYGLRISGKTGPGLICAVSTVEQIYKRYGYHVLDRVLRLTIGTWEGEDRSFSANILNALTKLVIVYGDTLIDDVFKEKLGAISIKQLTRLGKERGHGSLGYAETMVLEYNGKKKNSPYKLAMNKLYAKESMIRAELRRQEPIQDDTLDEDQEDLLLGPNEGV